MSRGAVVACLLLVAAHAAAAQIIPIRPGQVRAPIVKHDTTARADTTVAKFAPPDSMTSALLARKDFSSTRYQGDRVTFDVAQKSLDLLSPKLGVAIVQRGPQTVVSDSGIFYQERAHRVTTAGHYVLSDPSSGQADAKGFGRVSYNLAARTARIENANLALNNGEIWYMHVKTGALVADTSVGPGAQSLYARGGSFTSCDDSIPDYHFEVGDVKHVGNTIVARPAVLYIRDIPVMWLPFMFTDAHNGRHSGILPPRFGLGDIVRNSPSYRRNVDNVGYYWAPNEYADFATWLDWRSGAGTSNVGFPDPGWVKFNGEWQYQWLDRFLSGRIGTAYTVQNDHSTNLAVSWGHQEAFSRDSKFTTNINYVTNTTLQRQNNFNPYTVLATISSQANYQRKIGPASLNIGGTMRQYPGRTQQDRTFPTLSLTTGPLSLAQWLVWTPNFNVTASQTLHMDQAGPGQFKLFTNSAGQLDSVTAERGQRTAQLSFDTPFRIFSFELRNGFRIDQMRNDFPEQKVIYDVKTGAQQTRVFASTYRTAIEWNPDFQLPMPQVGGPFHLTPSVAFQNVDPGPFWVRTEQTNGAFVHQSKRPFFSLSASPTIYGLFPAFGPFWKLRHSISPTFGYGYAPSGHVSDEYLRATGQTRVGYLGSLAQNAINFGLNQNIEAKFKTKTDTNPDDAKPIKLLSLNATPLNFDFERLKEARSKGRGTIYGLTSQTFGYTLSSDLFPGFQFASNYSLFQGSTLSDSAVFSPYHESTSASFNISETENPFVIFARLFGKAVPEARVDSTPATNRVLPSPDQAEANRVAHQPVAGQGARGDRYLAPVSQGWRASFSLSSSRPRPPTGPNVIDFDPRVRCEQLAAGNPFVLQACLDNIRAQPTTQAPVTSTTAGGQAYRIPATTSLNSSINFNLTPAWIAAWQTTYDLESHQFASHIVQLQRDLHDWRAVFGFTQSPNGNFSFTFSIALKAEPDLKFDYNRATVRGGPSF